MLKTIMRQHRYLMFSIVIIAVVTIIFTMLTFQNSFALDLIFNDLVAEAKVPVYVGLISTIGIFIWVATASICLFMATFAWRQHWPMRNRIFWVYASVIFLIFAIDDAFLLHEEVILKLTGIPEHITFGFYGLLLLGFLGFYWQEISQTNFTILFLALSFMALSGTIDLLQKPLTNWYYVTVRNEAPASISVAQVTQSDDGAVSNNINIPEREVSWAANAMDVIEDGPKFLAIVFFCFYFAVTASDQLVARPSPQIVAGSKSAGS